MLDSSTFSDVAAFGLLRWAGNELSWVRCFVVASFKSIHCTVALVALWVEEHITFVFSFCVIDCTESNTSGIKMNMSTYLKTIRRCFSWSCKSHGYCVSSVYKSPWSKSECNTKDHLFQLSEVKMWTRLVPNLRCRDRSGRRSTEGSISILSNIWVMQ